MRGIEPRQQNPLGSKERILESNLKLVLLQIMPVPVRKREGTQRNAEAAPLADLCDSMDSSHQVDSHFPCSAELLITPSSTRGLFISHFRQWYLLRTVWKCTFQPKYKSFKVVCHVFTQIAQWNPI